MRIKKHLHRLLFWIGMSILFNVYIYFARGQGEALEYFGGYVIEMSLSLDNLFLFFLIFTNFNISKEYQERVLLYGVIGAMILRLIFILLGVEIVSRFNKVLSLFGVVLLYSGIKMLFDKENNVDYTGNISFKMLKKVLPITKEVHGEKFFIKENKVLYATPLLAALVVIECSDVIFAMDSIPAIFSITTNTFIVYTSNIFAILGLRSMYYILEKINEMFRFTKYGIAVILMFTGWKLVATIFGIEISVVVSVLIILIIILLCILLSLIFDKKR